MFRFARGKHMKVRDKNPPLKYLIGESGKNEVGTYVALGRLLNRPRQVRHEVNVGQISRVAKPTETVVVPGPVLAMGGIDKPVHVAALKFSKSAADKIVRAGGTILTYEELQKKHPDGKGVRILG